MFTQVSADPERKIVKRLVIDGDRIVEDKALIPTLFHFSRVPSKKLQTAREIFDLLSTEAKFGGAIIPTDMCGDNWSHGDRKGANFVRTATNVLIAEIDGLPFLDGYGLNDLIRDPAKVLNAHVLDAFELPDRFSYVAVISSSAGFSKKGQEIGLRFHLYLPLVREYAAHEIDWLDNYFQRKLGKVYDTSIRTPGHLLLVAPPEIVGCPDPFPQRIFLFERERRAAHFQLPDELDRFEPVKMMPKRGRSNSMPLLNKEAFDSESHRSDAVHKWVRAMRWRNPEMSWEQAYPILVTELNRVDASSGAWARLGGECLKEAKRMWEQFEFRGDQRSAYALPRYREPVGSVESAYDKMAEELEWRLEEPGVSVFKVSLGVGKTQQMIERATREKRNTVIMAPSIQRCEELLERLNTEEENRRNFDQIGWDDFEPDGDDGLPWMVWRGRQQPDMCERSEIAEEVHKAGGSVHSDLCGHGQDIKCPHFYTCRHASQYEAFGHVRWLVPSQSINQVRRIGNEAKVVFIDEGVTDSLAGQTSFKMADLLTPRGTRLEELSLKAHIAVAAGDTGSMSAQDFGLTRAEIEEALELEDGLRPLISILPNMADDVIRRRLESSKGNWNPALYSFWKQLLAEFDLERGFINSVHKYYARDLKEWRIKVAWRIEARFLNHNQVIVFFDATPNVVALRAHFPDIELVEFNAPNRNAHVAQVLNMSGRKNQFLALTDKSKEIDRAKSARENLAKWLKAQPGYTVCILPKAVKLILEEEHSFERVAFGHYGAVQGQDEWHFANGVILKGAEIDNLAQFGRSAPPAWEPEGIAMGHHWDGPKIERVNVPENGIPWYQQQEKAVAPGYDGQLYAGYVLRHPDERVDAVLQGICHSTQLQAFGRGRATRREKPLRVFIGHFLALDVEVAEALTAQELQARCGDVILLSPQEVERVFGYSGQFVKRIERKANVKYWMREKQTQPYRAWVHDAIDLETAMAEISAQRWAAIT